MHPTDEFPGYSHEYALSNEPSFFSEQELDRLLVHAAKVGASDLHIQTEEPIFLEVSGHFHRCTYRNITNSEVDILTNIFYGANGVARLNRAEDIDTSYQVNDGQEQYRFRVNVTACRSYGSLGAQITIRTIKGTPVPLCEQAVEQTILDNYRQSNGLVLVCGSTGSGKTTLLAGMMAEIASDPEAHEKIITYEAPIEFVYDNVVRISTVIAQHEVPRHIGSFAAAVRNALRRAPGIILVGESRDADTVSAALEAAETGHTVYTTVHTNSASETLYRLVNFFRPEERPTKMYEIIEALRLVIVQRLVRRADGKGRVAVREFLVFDQAIRDKLRHAQTLRETVGAVAQLVDARGQTMAACASRLFADGLIDERTWLQFETAKRAALIDDLEMQF